MAIEDRNKNLVESDQQPNQSGSGKDPLNASSRGKPSKSEKKGKEPNPSKNKAGRGGWGSNTPTSGAGAPAARPGFGANTGSPIDDIVSDLQNQGSQGMPRSLGGTGLSRPQAQDEPPAPTPGGGTGNGSDPVEDPGKPLDETKPDRPEEEKPEAAENPEHQPGAEQNAGELEKPKEPGSGDKAPAKVPDQKNAMADKPDRMGQEDDEEENEPEDADEDELEIPDDESEALEEEAPEADPESAGAQQQDDQEETHRLRRLAAHMAIIMALKRLGASSKIIWGLRLIWWWPAILAIIVLFFAIIMFVILVAVAGAGSLKKSGGGGDCPTKAAALIIPAAHAAADDNQGTSGGGSGSDCPAGDSGGVPGIADISDISIQKSACTYGSAAGGCYRLPESKYWKIGSNDMTGTKCLVQMIAATSKAWKQKHPDGTLTIEALNQPGHITHDNGTHVDISGDKVANMTVPGYSKPLTIEYGELWFSTNTIGTFTGVLFNDASVRTAVNDYVKKNKLQSSMRYFAGHEDHFHVQVEVKSDGTCAGKPNK